MTARRVEHLTQREAMDRLGISRHMIRKFEREGDLPRSDAGYPWPAIRDWYRAYLADQPEVLSQLEAADRLGVSARQIRRLGDAGIPRENGGYPWPQIREWYTDFKRREAVERLVGGGEVRMAYRAARARKETANAELHEIEVEKRRATFLYLEDVDELVGAPLRELARRVETLPGRIAPKLAGQPRPIGDVVTIIRDEVYDFLNELADDVPFPVPEPGEQAASRGVVLTEP